MAELENKQPCRNCGKEIGFHPKWKSKTSGAATPIEVQSDGKWTAHRCGNAPAKGGAPAIDYSEKLDKIITLLERISGQLAQNDVKPGS